MDMEGYEHVRHKRSYTPCDIFYLQVEIILHKKIAFKQHINQYTQCVLAHITNMLKSGGGVGDRNSSVYDASPDVLGSIRF